MPPIYIIVNKVYNTDPLTKLLQRRNQSNQIHIKATSDTTSIKDKAKTIQKKYVH